MWSVIKWLALRLAAVRWLFKLGGLAFLIPLALLLKTIGLPILGVLAVLALPVLVLLFLFGLPIFFVLIGGGLLMGLLGMVLTLTVAAIKIGLFVVLPIVLIWKLCSMIIRGGSRCKRKYRGDDGGDTAGTGATTPPPPDTMSGAATGEGL